MISREMPKYKSHKEVWALKIKTIVMDGEGENRETDGSAIITPEEEGYAPFRVDCGYVHKHKPQMGGYYVKDKDGYESFSPADAFEDGHESIGKPKSAEDKNLYNPTCAVTGERSNLNMFPIRNEHDEMIGWIFLNENLNRNAYDFSLNRELKD